MRGWRRADTVRAWLAALIAALAILTSAASAQEVPPLKGVALVIGQSAYAHLTPLPNPGNDARAIGRLLDDLGFDVDRVKDGDAAELRQALQRFLDDAAEADVALVYYSGHGIEAGGENFLIPIDASLASLGDAGERLIPLSRVLDELRSRVKISIVLVDACRTNPFPPDAKISLGGTNPSVPIAASGLAALKGMTVMEVQSGGESLGEVVGYAAQPGQVALDGDAGGNSPYAAALLKHLAANKGYEFGQVMTLVTEEVYLSTKTLQRPWTNASLRRFLNFGINPEDDTGDEALIRDSRRKLLVTIAATPDDLRRTVESLSQEKQVPLAGMYDVLRALGQSDIPKDTEKLSALLASQAEAIARMTADRKALDAEDPEIARLAALADRALDEGALPAARQFLDRAKARVEQGRAAVETQRDRLKAKDTADAAILARSAEAYIRDFNYLAAANDYAKAYRYVRQSDVALAFTYRFAEAGARQNHGDYKGDNVALRNAVATYDDALTLAGREVARHAWASVQNNLGNTLQILGSRESGTDTLRKAVEAYEAALTEYTRQRVPLDWAMTQNNLGNTLRILGARESGTDTLRKAVEAYEAALTEYTRERVPLRWATTQDNLGNVLWTLGVRESGTDTLRKAVEAYEAALTERTRERVPLDWAMTQNNLGNALQTLGARESGTDTLRKAVEALEAALTERTRERVPLQWATTQNNLGNALHTLGARESGTDTLRKAVEAYEAALTEFTRERVPLQWATAQNNLGNALQTLGARESGTDTLRKAVEAYEAALTERTRERVPLQWATTQSNLGNALQTLGARESGTDTLRKAVEAYEAALTERTRERVPLDWAMTQNNLGNVLQTLGVRESGTDTLRKAVEALEAALTERTRERVPLQWATTQTNLGGVRLTLGRRTKSRKLIADGKQAVEAAHGLYKSAGYDQYDGYFRKRIEEFDAALRALSKQ